MQPLSGLRLLDVESTDTNEVSHPECDSPIMESIKKKTDEAVLQCPKCKSKASRPDNSEEPSKARQCGSELRERMTSRADSTTRLGKVANIRPTSNSLEISYLIQFVSRTDIPRHYLPFLSSATHHWWRRWNRFPLD